MTQRLIRYSEFRAKGIPWSRMHVDRLEKQGKFPKRIRFGAATSCWIEDEIDAFVAAAFAKRDEAAA